MNTDERVLQILSDRAEQEADRAYERRKAAATSPSELAAAGFARDLAQAGITCMRVAGVDSLSHDERNELSSTMIVFYLERLATLLVGISNDHELALENLLAESCAALRAAAHKVLRNHHEHDGATH